MRIFILILAGVALMGCGNPGNFQPQTSITTLQKGEMSPHEKIHPQVSVIRNEAEWSDFWNLLYINLFPKPALPSVDFKKNYVVSVVDTPRPTGGYSITITGIQPAVSGITAKATQISPGRDCMLTQALTQPFHIVLTPVFSGGVTLELSHSVLNCEQ